MYVNVLCHVLHSKHMQPTNSDGLHDSTAAPIAVCSRYADSVDDIVGYSWQ